MKKMWDLYLILDFLPVAFVYRSYSDKVYDISGVGKKNCLTTSSLGWKTVMSLGQDEHLYIFSHQNTRCFIRGPCHGGRVGPNIQEFNSSLCTESEAILQNHWKSNSDDFSKLMQDYEKYRCVERTNWKRIMTKRQEVITVID